MDLIIRNGTNDDPDYPSATIGDTTYRIQWFGNTPSDDTYKHIRHLPRNKVVSYYNSIKRRLLDNINGA